MGINRVLAVTTVSTCLVLSISGEAQAKNIESYEDYRLYCSPAAFQYGVQSPDCSRYKGIYENRLQEELDQRQNRRRSTEQENREESGNLRKSFIGGTFGTYFPDADGVNTGYGGMILGGTKFNRNLGIDSEIGYLVGGTDIEGVDYNAWAFFISPRFMLPFTEKENPSYLYLSPGIGTSKASLDAGSISVEDDLRFTWQGKLGVSLPISEKYSSFAQVRYASQAADNTIDFFSSEVGFTFEY